MTNTHRRVIAAVGFFLLFTHGFITNTSGKDFNGYYSK